MIYYNYNIEFQVLWQAEFLYYLQMASKLAKLPGTKLPYLPQMGGTGFKIFSQPPVQHFSPVRNLPPKLLLDIKNNLGVHISEQTLNGLEALEMIKMQDESPDFTFVNFTQKQECKINAPDMIKVGPKEGFMASIWLKSVQSGEEISQNTLDQANLHNVSGISAARSNPKSLSSQFHSADSRYVSKVLFFSDSESLTNFNNSTHPALKNINFETGNLKELFEFGNTLDEDKLMSIMAKDKDVNVRQNFLNEQVINKIAKEKAESVRQYNLGKKNHKNIIFIYK